MTVQIEVGNTTFGYAEVKHGNNRGIKIWAVGTANSDKEYLFDPNPHENSKYIGNPPKFYREAAVLIGTHYNGNNNTFPGYGHAIHVLKEDYTLQQR